MCSIYALFNIPLPELPYGCSVAPVMFSIYSKSGCAFCRRAKTLLKHHHIPFVEHKCDEFYSESRTNFLDQMCRITTLPRGPGPGPGHGPRHDDEFKYISSFPFIFYNGKYVGGYASMLKCVTELCEQYPQFRTPPSSSLNNRSSDISGCF